MFTCDTNPVDDKAAGRRQRLLLRSADAAAKDRGRRRPQQLPRRLDDDWMGPAEVTNVRDDYSDQSSLTNHRHQSWLALTVQNVQYLYCNSHSVLVAAAARRRIAAGGEQLADADNPFAAAVAAGRNPVGSCAVVERFVGAPVESEELPSRCWSRTAGASSKACQRCNRCSLQPSSGVLVSACCCPPCRNQSALWQAIASSATDWHRLHCKRPAPVWFRAPRSCSSCCSAVDGDGGLWPDFDVLHHYLAPLRSWQPT